MGPQISVPTLCTSAFESEIVSVTPSVSLPLPCTLRLLSSFPTGLLPPGSSKPPQGLVSNIPPPKPIWGALHGLPVVLGALAAGVSVGAFISVCEPWRVGRGTLITAGCASPGKRTPHH